MDQTEMLGQMCRTALSELDIKAICKNRGLPAQAASSRGLLESLFVSDVGVADVLRTIDRQEIIMLHLLAAIGKPVDIASFSSLDAPPKQSGRYGTYTQRHQRLLSKVKERIVRRGILLMALAPDSRIKKAQMERWQFALPTQFTAFLPPLIEGPRPLDGEGEWLGNVARSELKTVLSASPSSDAKGHAAEIAGGELRLGGKPFRCSQLSQWQQANWRKEIASEKRRPGDTAGPFSPNEAVVYALGTLSPGWWCHADSLGEVLRVFCGKDVDSRSACDSGWRWGCLARQEADGRLWYRLAPHQSADDVPPERWLEVQHDGQVAVDLDTVPFEALERLVMISDQRAGSGRRSALLVTPNLVKLGQVSEELLASPLADWLKRHVPAFGQAFETLRHRRGKTIVHENLSVARVGDLSLKVTIERALGSRCVSLSDDYLAFPHEAIGEVRRLVTKSGHVIREAAKK